MIESGQWPSTSYLINLTPTREMPPSKKPTSDRQIYENDNHGEADKARDYYPRKCHRLSHHFLWHNVSEQENWYTSQKEHQISAQTEPSTKQLGHIVPNVEHTGPAVLAGSGDAPDYTYIIILILENLHRLSLVLRRFLLQNDESLNHLIQHMTYLELKLS